MPEQPLHEPAIGVLLSYNCSERGAQQENSVSAQVVWGVTPYLSPRVAAGSENEAIELLRSGLRNHASRPLLIFDDLQEAEEERYRNMRAGILLSEAFNTQTRSRLEQLFAADSEILRQSLHQFDRLVQRLMSVEAGSHDLRYLVPDFDIDDTYVYVPAHDPRYKRALAAGRISEETPVIHPSRTDEL